MPALTLALVALGGGLIAALAGAAEALMLERRKRKTLTEHEVRVVIDGERTVVMHLNTSAPTSDQLATEVKRVISESSL